MDSGLFCAVLVFKHMLLFERRKRIILEIAIDHKLNLYAFAITICMNAMCYSPLLYYIITYTYVTCIHAVTISLLFVPFMSHVMASKANVMVKGDQPKFKW